MFNPGDTVKLKSGGPIMTVLRKDINSSTEEETIYTCVWFNGSMYNSDDDGSYDCNASKMEGNFPDVTLVQYPPVKASSSTKASSCCGGVCKPQD